MTHFVGCIESLNAPNSSRNHKKIGNTSEVGPTMYISSANKRRIQVGWAITVGQTMQR
jgi:hypothetical protein